MRAATMAVSAESDAVVLERLWQERCRSGGRGTHLDDAAADLGHVVESVVEAKHPCSPIEHNRLELRACRARKPLPYYEVSF